MGLSPLSEGEKAFLCIAVQTNDKEVQHAKYRELVLLGAERAAAGLTCAIKVLVKREDAKAYMAAQCRRLEVTRVLSLRDAASDVYDSTKALERMRRAKLDLATLALQARADEIIRHSKRADADPDTKDPRSLADAARLIEAADKIDDGAPAAPELTNAARRAAAETVEPDLLDAPKSEPAQPPAQNILFPAPDVGEA